MIQRILNSKNSVACLLAAATGMILYVKMPFPEGNLFFELMFLWARPVFLGFKYSYIVFLYTTPYIGYSVLLSGLYIFALKIPQRIRPGRLPAYPDPRERPDLSIVLGEVHNPRKTVPAAAPHWLVVPERGLFTGIAIFGAVGTGKTSCCMYPFSSVGNLALKGLVETMVKAGLSPKTVNTYSQVVKSVVASAVNEEGEQLFPRKWNHEFVDMPVVDKSKQNTPHFTNEVITGILASSKGYKRMFCALLGGTGLRAGEALGIEVDKHISDDFRTLYIRQKVRRGKLEHFLKTESGRRDVDSVLLLQRCSRSMSESVLPASCSTTRTGILSHRRIS